MKLFIFNIAVMFGFAALAVEVPQNPLISCKLEGKNLKQYQGQSYQPFHQDAVVGELVLAEDISGNNPYKPKRLKIRKYYYLPATNADGEETGKLVRKGMPGAPLIRVGYTKLNNVFTFSYSQYDGGEHHSFQISTDGKKSVIGYSQDGWTSRGFQHSLDCEILKETAVEAPEVDLTSKTDKEKSEIILTLESEGRGNNYDNLDKIPASKWKAAKAKLTKMVNDFDFTENSPTTNEYKWPAKGCGDLVMVGNWDSQLKEVVDYKGNTIGWVITELECKNQLEYTYTRYDPNTGDPIERKDTRTVYINSVVMDTEFKLINLDEVRVNAY